jgi:two-component system response regulator LytT
MRILVFTEEQQVFHNLKDYFTAASSKVEIFASFKEFPDDFDNEVRKFKPDLVLINKTPPIENIESSLIYGGFKTTITITTSLQEYSFDAIHMPAEKQAIPIFENSENVKSNESSHHVKGSRFNCLNGRYVINNRPSQYRYRFLVKHGQKLFPIDIGNIAYFFSEGRFIFLRVKEGHKYLIDYRIEQLEQMLDPQIFFRVNRSFFVSIDAIQLVHSYPGNRLKLGLYPEAEKEVLVSRERVPDFRIWMGE